MEWVETTGRTIEAALDAALDELGVDENDVEYEVLQEPKTGLFARFGSGEARVRARVKPINFGKPGGMGERSLQTGRPGIGIPESRTCEQGLRFDRRARPGTPGGQRLAGGSCAKRAGGSGGTSGERARRERIGRRRRNQPTQQRRAASESRRDPEEHRGHTRARRPIEEQAQLPRTSPRLVDAFLGGSAGDR
jgi:spoIIIJ-associated protein